jgi:nucleotide-binding universal stress UspA family protein
MRFDRILVPTDFSPCARQAAEVALALASAVDGSVTLLNVYAPPPEPITDAGRYPPSSPWDQALAASRRALDELAASVRPLAPAVPIWVEPRFGDAEEEILRAADSGRFDLVILGTHGRRGVRRLVLGSVAESISRRSPIPVLTIRESSVERPSYREA